MCPDRVGAVGIKKKEGGRDFTTVAGGTSRTRTDTPTSIDELISNQLQYLLCLLFRVRQILKQTGNSSAYVS